MNFEFQHRQDSISAQQEKKDVLAEQDKKRQEIIRDFFIAGFVLAAALAFFIFRSYRQKQRDNDTITMQKAEVEQQKQIVEEKNKNIVDSMNYAKRIQTALLKDEERISMHLPDHFILFKPKDIVSGDFYWAHEKDNYLFFAAADCTGHGVPGAFMSMLGVSFLNEIISGASLLNPAQILDKLRERVLKELGQGEEHENKDGMDISLLRMNLKTREIEWSGANNPLYIICRTQRNVLDIIEPDKQPIGYFPVMKPFTNHSVKAETNSVCYLFTDGFADQFGGAKGKKFKYAQLQEKLLGVCVKPLAEQKKILNDTFEAWKGGIEQVDDVLIIGITV
ncbi:MAG: SpoIIE family protein phosphatase [Bacteroidia bacterium]|nr:SpoIIE family protein phosphatase [Bacteroidia bacterium]